MVRESGHAALQNGSSADVEQLLRQGRAKPAAFAGSCDDSGDVHGQEPLDCDQTIIIAHAPSRALRLVFVPDDVVPDDVFVS